MTGQFDRRQYQRRFDSLGDVSVVKEVGNAFLHSADQELREEIIDFLTSAIRGKPSIIPALLTSVYIVRELNRPVCVSMARRVVLAFPLGHLFRYALADCLDTYGDVDEHLEALKQRIIGIGLKMRGKRNTGDLARAQYAELVESDFGRLEDILAFLRGERKYPTDRVQMLAMRHPNYPEVSLKQVVRLVSLVNLAKLPFETRNPAKVTCVVDTNAISNASVSDWFGTPGLGFVAPAEVLLGLSDWSKISALPFSLDFVRIKLVPDRIPPEIASMFTRDSKDPPSLLGKKAAVLALREKADVIVTGERRLWDSDFPFLMEKYFAHILAVVQPQDFSTWLTNKGFSAPSPRIVPTEEVQEGEPGGRVSSTPADGRAHAQDRPGT